MKRLSLYLILLLFTLQAPSLAEDIRDFQVEGISVGDSLLDYFSEEEIKKNKRKTPFKSKKYSRYLIQKTKNYDALRFYIKSNDKNYNIYSLTGIKNYVNDYKGCLKEQKKIINDLDELFKNENNFKKTGPDKIISKQDKSKKSFFLSYRYIFNNGDLIDIVCYDWSENVIFADGLNVGIKLDEYYQWNLNEAWK